MKDRGEYWDRPPDPLPEQERCTLGYVPRPANKPARRPYDCKYGCKSFDDCIGKKMEGYKK